MDVTISIDTNYQCNFISFAIQCIIRVCVDKIVCPVFLPTLLVRFLYFAAEEIMCTFLNSLLSSNRSLNGKFQLLFFG